MQKANLLKLIRDFIVALITATVIFYSMALAAAGVVNSPVYRQSKIVSMLVQNDPASFKSMLEDRRGAVMFIKFAGALTSAYINFELIPVNEPATFVEVFESLPGNVNVDGFEYRRKDLSITGTAKSEKDYLSFKNALQSRDYFSLVTGSSYELTQGGVRFEIICVSNAAEAYLSFQKQLT